MMGPGLDPQQKQHETYPTVSNDLDTLWGRQGMPRPFGHSIRTPYMSVILPNRRDPVKSAERTYSPRLHVHTKNYSIII